MAAVVPGITYRDSNDEKKGNLLSFLEVRKSFIEVPSTSAMTITESLAHSLTHPWQGAQESDDWLSKRDWPYGSQPQWPWWGGLDVRESTTIATIPKTYLYSQSLSSKNALIQMNIKARHTTKKPHNTVMKQTIDRSVLPITGYLQKKHWGIFIIVVTCMSSCWVFLKGRYPTKTNDQ